MFSSFAMITRNKWAIPVLLFVFFFSLFGSGMETYRNLGGDSGVVAYETGSDFIRVQFHDGSIYLYTYRSAGVYNIERMKGLAEYGEGLNTFINKYVRKRYERRER